MNETRRNSHAHQALFIGILAAAPFPAFAQPRTVWHQLSFEEVNAATGAPVLHPNGILEPGEGARISLALAFDPPVNTILVEPPLVAGLRVHAAAYAHLHVESQGEATGTWTGLAVGPGWDEWMGDPPEGVAHPSGHAVYHIRPFQHAVGADTRNPAPNVWSGIWVPDSYLNRQVRFHTWPPGIAGFQRGSQVWHEGAPGEFHSLDSWTQTGKVYIPIIPAPSAALTLALSTALTLRRRR